MSNKSCYEKVYTKQKPKTRQDLLIHFKKRLLERYAIEISNSEVNALVDYIENHNFIYYKFIENQSNNRVLFEVHVISEKYDAWIPVIYNRKLNMLVTVLPKGYNKDPNHRWFKE